MRVNESIANKKGELNRLEDELAVKKAELAIWQEKRDPEPPFQQEQTRQARQMLLENDAAFIPFYEAVEFQEFVPEDIRKRIEAALLDAGMLDALIATGDTPIVHDRVIQPNPNMMAHTLADYLVPDVSADSGISPAMIDDVLRSVRVEDDEMDAGLVIQENGTYRIGLLQGHAVEVEAVRFIGKNARKRYRQQQIAAIEQEIDVLEANQKEISDKINLLTRKIASAKDAMNQFPDEKDLQEGFHQIKEKRFEIVRLGKELQRLDAELQTKNHAFAQVKRNLDDLTRDLNIALTYEAYMQAKHIMHSYEKKLSTLITKHTSFCHLRERLVHENNRMEELMAEVDDLQGELNMLEDKKIRVARNMEEMEKQLAAHGVEDIRKQIQEVQQDLQASKEELDLNKETVPEKKSARSVLLQEIDRQQQKADFLKKMANAWLQVFITEVDYGFTRLPDELQTNEQRASWVEKTYKEVLQEKDPSKVNEQLTKTFYEQQSNLMEYRMDDTQTAVTPLDWMDADFSEEQRIEINDWKQKAKRRIVQLDFQGQRVSPYYVLEMVEKDQLRQQNLLDDQDRKLYEEILFDSVGKKLRSRIARAQKWTEKMDKLMAESDSSSGLSFSIKWKPRTAETEAEMDTKELVDLLRRDPRLLKEEDINQVIDHFRSKIERAKELVELKGEGSTLLQVLKEVLDYRYWFSFVLSFKREGEPKRELTDHAFFQFSGGEKAMAMYIPLFTACYSRYSEAAQTAPYIISLDEAFAGVDEDNISVMFRVVEQLGFDYMMNSQVLWGDYDTVSSLSVCELVRPKNQDFVTVIRYYWDGSKRSLVVEDMEDPAEKSVEEPMKI
ncbi:TIGR02680 family protein [Virgibacillus sp. 179-BFC.A HS]|uniref:TIGR02680 family protein n=1 Tax=Tigheibacillus jepli TaxID=3035914 RepID=A0ABU5CFA8_9BACI|nr:TIGR02680 family protein [Virgibacillus sp. 179-BFC.A HS]MDY0405019.1 TIGR02680 family protein [Virgibacillus sp. 179-BFC.A HS]